MLIDIMKRLMKVRASLLIGALAAAPLALGAQAALQSGLDVQAFDRSVRPADDLFRHVNGTWLQKTEIPPDRPMYGTFVQLVDQSESDLQELIQSAAKLPGREPGSPAQQIGDLYASFMDEKRINALGATPLAPSLAEIDAIKTTAELATVLGRLSMIGVPGAIGGY